MIIGFTSLTECYLKNRFATSFAKSLERPVRYLDCDVKSTLDTSLLNTRFERREPVEILLPEVDGYACMGCGDCAEACDKEAIVLRAGMPLAFAECCDACGDCVEICIPSAITLKPRVVGDVRLGICGTVQHVAGRLNAGDDVPIPVINATIRYLERGSIGVVNCPTWDKRESLSVLKHCDYAVFLVEPSKNEPPIVEEISEIAKQANVKARIVLVKSMSNNPELKTQFSKAGIPILWEFEEEDLSDSDNFKEALNATFESIASECGPDFSPQN